MSHPSNLKKFRAWAKAMEQGATVGKPDYGKSLKSGTRRNSNRRNRRRHRRRGRRRFLQRRKQD